MATTLAQLVTRARSHINEQTPGAGTPFWTDAELVELGNRGIKDLWRRINDLYQDYFVTLDITNMSLPASSNTISGVPTDLFRVVSIEPRVLGQLSTNPGLIFKNKAYNSPEFVQARARGALSPDNTTIYYCLMNAGAPVGAPTIYCAPQVSGAVNLRVLYNQTLADQASDGSGTNPVPGESDNAIIAWMVAYALGKENASGVTVPDPGWLAVYATEKTNLITSLTPRSTQEPSVVEGMFEDYDGWGNGGY